MWLLPQTAAAREVRAAPLLAGVVVDGILDDPAWAAANAAADFLQADPAEGAPASSATRVRVLAGSKAIVIGIECDDADPAGIVSFSKQRDAELESEDHVRVVLGPFLDGRSGYVFAVNPAGARFDGLIEPGGESANANWDGIWEAATTRTARGWSVEIRIPIETLAFNPDLREWHFNVERRIQRLLETDRWASAERQFQVTQTSRAGLLVGLPEFALGVGLTVRPSMTTGGGIPAHRAPVAGKFQPSLDVTQRVGGNMLASLTANTDFAETEVDTRRTNLTRFPLFFPEKRTFFLEGSDIFSFGLGLNEDLLPYFSRRIGLVSQREVPILGGAKLNGRVDRTNVGGLLVGTNDKDGVVDDEAVMAVGRVKQNVGRESWVGGIAHGRRSAGPIRQLVGRRRCHLRDVAVSRRQELPGRRLGTGDRSRGPRKRPHRARLQDRLPERPVGYRLDLQTNRTAISIRRSDSSRGAAVHLFNGQINNSTRIAKGPLQRLFHEFQPSLATDLRGRWESYRVFMAPINWRFRSGDRLELNVNPTGERLIEPAEIGGVTIAPGSYHWRRYRVEVSTAKKRRLYSQLTWWFGGFYDGQLDQFEWEGAWNPTPLLTIEFSGEINVARGLSAGDFTETVVGTRARAQLLAGSQPCELCAVRHDDGVDRRQHAASVDVQAGR